MRFAPIAQWIEHLPSKQVAVGSNPTGRAKDSRPLAIKLKAFLLIIANLLPDLLPLLLSRFDHGVTRAGDMTLP